MAEIIGKPIEPVVKRLEKLIGTEYDENEIVKAFKSDCKIIIHGEEWTLEPYGKCTKYSAFDDVFDDRGLIEIFVTTDNKIVKVKELNLN